MRVISLFFFIFLSGCQSNKFEKVDFKYSNLAHMSVDDALIELEVDPKKLIFALSDSFRAQNNMVLERQKIDFFNKKLANYQACYNAQNEIFKTEFLAYQQNDFSIYKSLNREEVYSKYGFSSRCVFFESVKSDVADSWFLKVEIPQGNFNTTISVPNVESFFAVSGLDVINGSSTSYHDRVVTTNFSSHLYIWAWKETPDSRTKVYLYARPVNGQVEACGGCSIGYKWWKQANGYTESRLVKHYKYLLEDLANKNLF